MRVPTCVTTATVSLVLAALGCASPTAKRPGGSDVDERTEEDRDGGDTLLASDPVAADPGGDSPSAGDPGGGDSIAARCFPQAIDPTQPSPSYDRFNPVVNSQCLGTDHQEIAGVQRVVFLGDSVTVGVPNLFLDLSDWGLPAGAGTPSAAFYRNILADRLATRFNLAPPGSLWREVDLLHGKALQQASGDFAVCAVWGGDNADILLPPEQQLEVCLPLSERDKVTLIVMTSGSNDLARMTRHAIEGATLPQMLAEAATVVQNLEDAVAWIKTPGRFPNGVFLVMGNIYEFTDGTGVVTACPSAALAGYSEASPDPTALAEATVWILDQYVRVATQYAVDLIFMLEHFCGHGWRHDDPSARCYLGPNSPLWFDVSCTHPNELGHLELADQFWSVVVE